MLERAFAHAFATEWIASWNSHDLDRILSHYSDDFEFSSPLIVEFMGEPSGRLQGKASVARYWSKGLARLPDLHFELLGVLTGMNSLVIHYRRHDGKPVMEYFEFGPDSKVTKSSAHYAAPQT